MKTVQTARGRLLIAAAALVGMAAMGLSTAASALTIKQILEIGGNNLSDNSGEYLINSDGRLSDGTCAADATTASLLLGCGGVVAGDSILNVGDRVRLTFAFDTITNGAGQTTIGGASGNSELSGLADLTVIGSALDGAAFVLGVDGCAGGVGISCTHFFAPTAAFHAEAVALGAPAAAPVGSIGAVLLEDATPGDYSRTDTGVGTKAARILALEATATDGAYRAALGVTGDGDELVTLTAFAAAGLSGSLHDVTVWGAKALNSSHSSVGLQLQIVDHTGLGIVEVGQVAAGVPLADGLIDANGGGGLVGIGGGSVAGSLTPYDYWDDFNIGINVQVPEPGMVGLMGAGLFVLAAVQRRRRVKVA